MEGEVPMRSPSSRFVVILLASSVLTPAAAWAQQGPPAAPESATVDEIVVTAQRREERLIDVPISVSAIGGAALERARVSDVSGIANYVPNIQINPTVGNNFGPLITIRGLAPSSDTSLGRDQPVGIYIDGVPISKSTGAAFDTVDLERVEVLRGPQGTLYGKNTIGGAVNLVTRAPTGEFGGRLQLGVGNQDLFEQRLSLNLPRFGEAGQGLGALDVKFAYSGRTRDGFFRNTHPTARHDDFGSVDQDAFRIDLVWRPAEALRFAYAYDNTSSYASPTMLAISSLGSIGPASPFYGLLAPAVHTSRPKAIANDSAGRSDFFVRGHALVTTYEAGQLPVLGEVTIKSITAHRDLRTRSSTDFDGTATDLVRFQLNNNYKQYSEELQVIGTNGPLRYTVGAFVLNDEYQVNNPRWSFQFGGNRYSTYDRTANNTSVALYGQATWTPQRLEERLSITVGGRLSKDFKRTTALSQDYATYAANPNNLGSGVFQRTAAGAPITRSGGPALGALPGPGNIGPSDLIPMTVRGDWSEFTPELNVTWKLREDWNVYGRYATGFKSGGNNDVAVSNSAFLTAYQPERLKSYELGTKGVWFDRRLSLSAAVYYSEYKDFQAGVFVPALVTTSIINAGEAHIAGLEVEGFLRPVERLRIDFGYGRTRARYDEFILPNGQDVTNLYVFTLTPKENYALGVSYEFGFVGVGDLSASLNYSWRAKQATTITNDPASERPAYGLLDGRVALANIPVAGRQLELALWGKNLTDEAYVATAINLGVFTVRQWGEPRSFGLQANLTF
jgi:iron complex outermembrane recepter protein